jgi:hypothetical protein
MRVIMDTWRGPQQSRKSRKGSARLRASTWERPTKLGVHEGGTSWRFISLIGINARTARLRRDQARRRSGRTRSATMNAVTGEIARVLRPRGIYIGT